MTDTKVAIFNGIGEKGNPHSYSKVKSSKYDNKGDIANLND